MIDVVSDRQSKVEQHLVSGKPGTTRGGMERADSRPTEGQSKVGIKRLFLMRCLAHFTPDGVRERSGGDREQTLKPADHSWVDDGLSRLIAGRGALKGLTFALFVLVTIFPVLRRAFSSQHSW